MNEHVLRSRRPWPGSDERDGADHLLRWTGAAWMGVVNVTPDSFSDGGQWSHVDAAVARARQLADEGALIIDVGGESTRPGAEPVDPDEERRRVLPVVERLIETGRVAVSVDTRRAEVAADALERGAHLVNDVGGLRDAAMRAVVAEAGVPAVAMHMQGEPGTMQDAPSYENVAAEVERFLLDRAAEAEADGIPSVILDPGWGFGKRDDDNLALLDVVERLAAVGRTVLLGASRKGTIGRLSNEPDPARRDPGSYVVHLEAARRGAALLRVHDVAGHRQAMAIRAALDARRVADRSDARRDRPTDRAADRATDRPTDRPSDRIVLDGMAFHGYHGVFPEEARFGARFVVDLELRVDLPEEDALEATIDYAAVYDLVAHEVTAQRYQLIEALASAIATRVLDHDRRIEETTVRVHKPHAPLPGVVRDVVAEVTRRR